MVMPGDNVEMTVTLVAPIALEKGTKFAIRRWKNCWCWSYFRNHQIRILNGSNKN